MLLLLFLSNPFILPYEFTCSFLFIILLVFSFNEEMFVPRAIWMVKKKKLRNACQNCLGNMTNKCVIFPLHALWTTINRGCVQICRVIEKKKKKETLRRKKATCCTYMNASGEWIESKLVVSNKVKREMRNNNNNNNVCIQVCDKTTQTEC